MNFNKLINLYLKWRFERAYKICLEHYLYYYEKKGFEIFKDESRITKWASNSENKLSQPICRKQPWIESLEENAFKWYCGYYAENINPLLRNPKYPANDVVKSKVFELIPLIDNEITHRELGHKLIVVRWQETRWFEPTFGIKLGKVKKNIIIEDKGYLSTSLNLYFKGKYDTEDRDLSQNIFFILEVPTGTKGIYLNEELNNRNEYELLIARSSRIKVKEIYHRLKNTAIIVGEVIL